jgi:nicotinamide riboside kinase
MPFSKKTDPLTVVLFGAECTGKSTLAFALSQAYDMLCNPEYVRAYLENRHRLGLIAHQRTLDYEEVEAVALGQLISERQALAQAKALRHEFVFLDTNLLSTAIYSREIYGKQPDWLEHAIDSQVYDLYFFLEADFEWQNDAQRASREVRRDFQHIMRMELETRGIDYIRIGGSLEERLALCKTYLESL